MSRKSESLRTEFAHDVRGMELFKNGRLKRPSKFQEAQSLFPQDLPLQFLTSSLKRTLEQGQTIRGRSFLISVRYFKKSNTFNLNPHLNPHLFLYKSSLFTNNDELAISSGDM